jgi:polyferredoxin
MALIELKFDPSPREVKQFTTLWLPAAFAILGGIVWYASGSLRIPALLWSIGIVLGVAGTLSPLLGRVLFIAWMSLTYPIGWVMSHLLLGLIYFGVMTPVGLVLRAFGRDRLERELDRSAPTYWTERPPSEEIEGYFRQS